MSRGCRRQSQSEAQISPMTRKSQWENEALHAPAGQLGMMEVARAYRLLAGTVVLGGLALQFWLMLEYPDSRSIAQTVTRFLSFFTIQTNILIAACTLLPALVPGSAVSRLLCRPSVRS